MDTVFNKAGWHFPQQRMITLWGDVKPTVEGARPPEPGIAWIEGARLPSGLAAGCQSTPQPG